MSAARESLITLVHDEGGDWIGLYIDGVLTAEGHSISEREMVRSLRPFASFDEVTLDMQADDWPGLPQRLEELPRV